METYYGPGSTSGLSAQAKPIAGGLQITSGGKAIHWAVSRIHKKIEKTEGGYLFRYGNAPEARLEATEKQLVMDFLSANPRSGHYLQQKKSAVGIVVFIVSLLVLLPLLAYFYLLPPLADSVARSLPKEKEEQIGEKIYRGMGRLDINATKTKLLGSFFNELGYQTAFSPKLHVVNDPVVNAYATPGSHIVVNTGILRVMSNSDELAALLAHELSHINCRHITRSLCRNAGNWIMLSLVVGDLAGINGVLLQGASQLRSLGFSREFEEEADREGFAQLIRCRINADGMISLFAKLQKEQGLEVAEFVSTHPDLNRRMEYTHRQIERLQPVHNRHPRLDSLFAELSK